MAPRTEVRRTPRRGEIWWCDHPDVGRRPVVVLSRNETIARLGSAIVAPCTTHVRLLASEVHLEPGEDPVPRRSAVNLDSVTSVSTALLTDRLGQLGYVRMQQVCATLAVATGCDG